MKTCFQALQRTPMNRTGLKRLRNSGRLPANVFGSGANSVHIHLSAREFAKWIRSGGDGLVELNLENHGPITVFLEAVQRDPVTREYIHADFIRVKEDEQAQTQVNAG
ncbi:hypothetical protein NYE48_16635 [Paenibacillus sp. FSL M7-1455]|uniref:hypothetical protein n=1 Tax=Paenibacillus sp. FSL M7-1455 TaxID=2975316 RepID=UPI0030F72428